MKSSLIEIFFGVDPQKLFFLISYSQIITLIMRCSFYKFNFKVFIELTCLKIYHRYMGQNITKHFRFTLIASGLIFLIIVHRTNWEEFSAGTNEFLFPKSIKFSSIYPHSLCDFQRVNEKWEPWKCDLRIYSVGNSLSFSLNCFFFQNKMLISWINGMRNYLPTISNDDVIRQPKLLNTDNDIILMPFDDWLLNNYKLLRLNLDEKKIFRIWTDEIT